MIHINAKSIGIKTPVSLNETMENVKNAFKLQRDLIKITKPVGKNSDERLQHYFDGQLKAIDIIVDYVADVLGLSSKRKNSLYKVDYPKIKDLADQIVMKMLHYDQQDKNNSSQGKK